MKTLTVFVINDKSDVKLIKDLPSTDYLCKDLDKIRRFVDVSAKDTL